MTAEDRTNGFGRWMADFIHLSSNALSFFGIFLVNTAAVAWFFLLPVEAREGAQHPYLGIVFLVVLPGIFLAGLIFIPLGILFRRRRERATGRPEQSPALEWANVEVRRMVLFVGGITALNVLLGGYYTHATVSYMDHAEFCGNTCHGMAPEYVAYRDSPHRNVACIDCHVGEGTTAYLQSKLNGTRQLISTVRNTFPRPIPTPIHNLRPADEVCESCHWPGNFGGFRFRVWPRYATDEQNTEELTVLIMRIGGGAYQKGIHGAHVAPGVEIEYAANPSRQEIPWVRYTDPTGKSVEYVADGWDPSALPEYEKRVMDCLDCHTRPAHRFRLPRRALEIALALEKIDSTLPWIMKHGMELLEQEYASHEEAAAKIPPSLTEIYRSEHPEVFAVRGEEITQAGRELIAIYQRNVFPEMNIGWGNYPDHIGHEEFPGCFRCHDDSHMSEDGRAITQDCSACHLLLAMDEPEQDILDRLGIEP